MEVGDGPGADVVVELHVLTRLDQAGRLAEQPQPRQIGQELMQDVLRAPRGHNPPWVAAPS